MNTRHIDIMINIDDIADLPEAGHNLAKFIEEIDIPHGPFSVTVAVGVGGVDIGDSASPEIVFIPDMETEDDNEGEDYHGTHK